MSLSRSAPRVLHAGTYRFVLDRPLIMGILNVTPDSFSDGGRFFGAESALDRARQMMQEGADIIDVGGESTRPGAEAVGPEEELRRLRPVVELLAPRFPISVDTSKPDVMREVLPLGVAMVNDVRALREPDALETVAGSGAAVCLMHMLGTPRSMQQAPHYDDVVAEVGGFLKQRAEAAEAMGIARERIVIDPGFGFGKTAEHNLTLWRRLSDLRNLGWPVMAGLSRKSTLGQITGRAVDDRLFASVAAAMLAVQRGAEIVRVHDVAPTRDALAILRAVETESRG
ncbi:MAG: dihydropteroate synthase [Betaproteobacteria bacterium]|nr:dihydropteroate synthase [Betaproteobacteria bacterium]